MDLQGRGRLASVEAVACGSRGSELCSRDCLHRHWH